MGKPGGFGHGDIDDDAELQRLQRLFHLGRVGRGVRRVRAVDPDAAQAVGMVAQHGLRKQIGRQQARDHLGVGRGEFLVGRVAPQRLQPAVQLVGAFPAETAGQHDQEFFQIGVECRIDPLLDAELDADRHRLGGHDHVDAALDLLERDVGGLRPRLDRNAAQRRLDLGQSFRVVAEEIMVQSVAPNERCQDRAEQEGIGAGPHGQMQIGHLGGLGAARIDHDQLARRDPCESG